MGGIPFEDISVYTLEPGQRGILEMDRKNRKFHQLFTDTKGVYLKILITSFVSSPVSSSSSSLGFSSA
jgi:hypothetical protein